MVQLRGVCGLDKGVALELRYSTGRQLVLRYILKERPRGVSHGLEKSPESFHVFLTELLKYKMDEPCLAAMTKVISSEHLRYLLHNQAKKKWCRS